MRGLAGPAVFALLLAVFTHVALLFGAPFVAADFSFARMLERGGAVNHVVAFDRVRAGDENVPLTNADTRGARAVIDLSAGPLTLDALVPEGAAYWSLTVFAHNTDTITVVSDQDLPPGPVRFLLLGPGHQPGAAEGRTLIRVPTRRAYLLVRSFQNDPDDADEAARAMATLRAVRLAPATGP